MEITAQLKSARMVPRKARPLREVVNGLPVTEALAQLDWQRGEASKIVAKVMSSAVANAKENFDIEEGNLKVSDLEINAGARFKRHRPVSRGMAHPFVKQTAHIKVVLEEITESASKAASKKKTEIETLTVDELAKREVPAEEVVPEGQSDKAGSDAAPSRDASGQAQSKMKTMQQGGDKQKTHRRKSI